MKWETKNLLTWQNWKNWKDNDKAENVHITKIQMRLKCKKRQLLVYVDGWTVQKSLLHEYRLQKPLEIAIF